MTWQLDALYAVLSGAAAAADATDVNLLERPEASSEAVCVTN